jgi:phenylacetate-CoA ligase
MYDASPAFIQTLMLNMYAGRVHKERYGRVFHQVADELEKTQYFHPQQIAEYQRQRLRAMVRHAYDSVPYYRELFDSRQLTPDAIRTEQDLHLIPLLTKDDVRNNIDRLISTRYPKDQLIHGHTSGTTGSPLDVYWDRNVCVYTNAVDWRQKNWAGVHYRDRIALLLGRMVVPAKQGTPPFWRMNFVHNQLWMSAFHMNEKNLEHYIAKLDAFQPAAIEGYPSTVYILARYLEAKGRVLPVRAVFTSSETLHSFQRETIERAFNCKIFDYYGMAERVVFATECQAHAGRHLNFEYGLTEVVDKNGYAVASGENGIVVSTSLQNFGMPLIRYKTSDMSNIQASVCACGRHMPLLAEVTTKAEDIVTRPDGTLISPSILTHPFKPMYNIEESQIIQEDLTHITIKIVKRPGYTDKDSATLLEKFQERVGSDMIVRLDFVDSIPRTKAGKFRWVISKVGASMQNPKDRAS